MIPYLIGAVLAGFLFVKAADTVVAWRMSRHSCQLHPTEDVLVRAKVQTDRVDEMLRQMGAV